MGRGGGQQGQTAKELLYGAPRRGSGPVNQVRAGNVVSLTTAQFDEGDNLFTTIAASEAGRRVINTFAACPFLINPS